MPLGQVAKNLSILDMRLDYGESDILSTKLNLSAECKVQGAEGGGEQSKVQGPMSKEKVERRAQGEGRLGLIENYELSIEDF